MNGSFQEDILAGLQRDTPHIPTHLYYGALGDALYDRIRELPEYPLFRVESGLVKKHAMNILAPFSKDDQPDIVELGAGEDGRKLLPLLEQAAVIFPEASFCPVDISGEALEKLKAQIQMIVPDLTVIPVQGDYSEALKKIKRRKKRVLLVLIGSNLGNLNSWAEINDFLSTYVSELRDGSYVLLGVDGVQNDTKKMEQAYDDSEGVTDKFNRLVLERVQSEIDSTFDPYAFERRVRYDPEQQVVEAVFVPKKDCLIEAGNTVVSLPSGIPILAERSFKFSEERLKKIAQTVGLSLVQTFDNPREDWSYHLHLYKKSESLV